MYTSLLTAIIADDRTSRSVMTTFLSPLPFLTARESVAAASVQKNSSWLRNDLYALTTEERITSIPQVIFNENTHCDTTKCMYI